MEQLKMRLKGVKLKLEQLKLKLDYVADAEVEIEIEATMKLWLVEAAKSQNIALT